MKFKEAPDDPENTYFHRMVSVDGKFYICVYPVLFGFRVRCGETDNKYFCAVDACAGNDPDNLTILYNLYLAAMERCQTRDEILEIFRRFPSSRKKPFNLDDEFTVALLQAAGDESGEIKIFTGTDLFKMRMKLAGPI